MCLGTDSTAKPVSADLCASGAAAGAVQHQGGAGGAFLQVQQSGSPRPDGEAHGNPPQGAEPPHCFRESSALHAYHAWVQEHWQGGHI